MTRVRISALLAILVCGLAFPGGVSAHHSIQAQFDVNKTLTISGAVTKVEFINPHSYLTLNVKGADGPSTRCTSRQSVGRRMDGRGPAAGGADSCPWPKSLRRPNGFTVLGLSRALSS